MKYFSLILFLFQACAVFSQPRFTINGKTNIISTGKAVLSATAPSYFYPFSIKKDTVEVQNQKFEFEGNMQYPERLRITFIDANNSHYITEPFFVNASDHNIYIDSATYAHDLLEVGVGVSIDKSTLNDEYISKYLPLYTEINKKIEALSSERKTCNTIKDDQKRKGCVVRTENERLLLRDSSDSVLLQYSKTYSQSPIMPWLIYAAVRDHGYTNYYQDALSQITPYIPSNVKKLIGEFLNRQKIKAPGNIFPLLDFVKTNTPKGTNGKYTLVEFWFSSCAPCISQFKLLKNTYQKFNSKGFNIVAISIDRQEKMAEYEAVVKKNNYPWQQILDLNGVKTKSIDINEFPTSFLLDHDGRIIKTNIRPTVLDSFLEDNL